MRARRDLTIERFRHTRIRQPVRLVEDVHRAAEADHAEVHAGENHWEAEVDADRPMVEDQAGENREADFRHARHPNARATPRTLRAAAKDANS